MKKALFILHSCVVLLCLFFSSCAITFLDSREGQVTEIVSVYDAEQILNPNIKEGNEYIIKSIINLKGENILLPPNVLISFEKKGAIVNGAITGCGTRIKSKYDNILGVKLKGTWCVEKISDLAFNKEYLSDQDIIDNINTIQSDTVFNTIIINRPYEVTIQTSGGSGLIPSSHSSITIHSDITLKENNFKSYQIVDIRNKEDVAFRGGRIIGDVGRHSYIEGSTSEWGMGIRIMQSHNVTISDVYITKCTGDGIYLTGGEESSVGIYDNSSKNIVLNNVVSDNNRRQGLSIIHVDGLVVKDCFFINTGQIEFTAPGAGIDIEPNVSGGRNMSVKNIVIDNCNIKNNRGLAVETNNTYEINGLRNYQNILFSNCQTDGLLKAQSDDVTYRNCTFKEVRFASVYSPTHIYFENCIITGGFGIIIFVPSSIGVQSKDRLLALGFKGCIISTVEENTKTDALISCYKSYVQNLEYVSFDECHFIIPEGKSEKYSFTDYSFNGKLRIKKCVIEMKGHIFDANGMELSDNEILCRAAEQLPEGSTNKVITRY